MMERTHNTLRRAAGALFSAALLTGVVVPNGPAVAASAKVHFHGVVIGGPKTVLDPMQSSVVSFSDRAAFKLKSVNRGAGQVTVRLEAFSNDMTPLDATIHPQSLRLAPGNTAVSTVIVPLEDQAISNIRICAVHTDRAGSAVDRVCGQYLAKRIALSE